ncbi:MAG: hypothetical protein LBU73_02720 [Helicobacteraceae bacterium]|nr:hypothetical protein [Helicobacteraceae bacterium]
MFDFSAHFALISSLRGAFARRGDPKWAVNANPNGHKAARSEKTARILVFFYSNFYSKNNSFYKIF